MPVVGITGETVPEPAAVLEFAAGYGGELEAPEAVGTGYSVLEVVLKEKAVPDALLNGVGVDVTLVSG